MNPCTSAFQFEGGPVLVDIILKSFYTFVVSVGQPDKEGNSNQTTEKWLDPPRNNKQLIQIMQLRMVSRNPDRTTIASFKNSSLPCGQSFQRLKGSRIATFQRATLSVFGTCAVLDSDRISTLLRHKVLGELHAMPGGYTLQEYSPNFTNAR